MAVAGLAAGLAVGVATSAEAQSRVEWKMQSAFGSKISIIGEVATRYEGLVDDLSAGTFKLEFHEPGALVPALERGVVDAAEFSMPSIDLDYGFPSERRRVGGGPALRDHLRQLQGVPRPVQGLVGRRLYAEVSLNPDLRGFAPA